jgi:hypothetical protein
MFVTATYEKVHIEGREVGTVRCERMVNDYGTPYGTEVIIDITEPGIKVSNVHLIGQLQEDADLIRHDVWDRFCVTIHTVD